MFYNMKIFYIIITFLLLINCNGKTETKKIYKDTNDDELPQTTKDGYVNLRLDSFPQDEKQNITTFFNNQFKDEIQTKEMISENLRAASILLSKSLKKEGYIPPTNDVFYTKIKDFFQIDVDKKNEYLVKHDGFFTYLVYNNDDKTLLYESEFDNAYSHLFFIQKYNFITGMPLFGSFELNTNKKDIEVYFDPKLLHQNQYIFYNSNASLTWLINNDLYFLRILVMEFGYDKNDKINAAVLDKIYKDYQSGDSNKKVLKDLFAKRDCYGVLQIREGLMKYISDSTTKKNHLLLDMLEQCGYDLTYNNCELFTDLSTDEQKKVAAYILYYVHKAYVDNEIQGLVGDWNQASVLYNTCVSNKELIQFIENNNYYNLPSYQDFIYDIKLQIEDANNN